MRGGVGAVVGDELVLGGVEALAKTWGIVKGEREWGEVIKAVEWAGAEGKKAKFSKSEWLAQAEISTCTRSQVLLQQSHLNLPSNKITVRREVSAGPIADSGSDGAFLGSGTDDMFAASSSLDATLASAITGSLSPTSKAQQIPSFPNAYSGGKSISWNDPARRLSRLSDGFGQGLGSLKREIGKVRPSSGSGERRARSPKSPPPTVETTPGIKLEFDDDAIGISSPMKIWRQVILKDRLKAEDDASRSAESGSGSVPSTVPDMTMLTSPHLETTPGIKLGFDDDALFEVDEDLAPSDIEGPVEGGGLRPSPEDDASRSAESGSGSVPSTVPDMTMLTSPEPAGDWPGDGDSFGGEEEEYIQTRAEDHRFDDLVVGLMDEEEEERRVVMESATSIKKKHKKER
ncbi:hypothetical protein RSAG8_13062, partial [Rhizoctonia solani AG-8 WAC10335]